ncbi:MAG: hypothetical protein GX794_00380 [Acholeplasmataceae bacterium]|jgi:hypothetical protein|nr:hypothetical protein [Acholeplasmataceae bacterium]
MKKYLLVLLILAIFSLVGCIDTSGPNYIESIDVYVDGELLEGKVQYYNQEQNKWLDFDDYKEKEKINVYYTFNVPLDKEIKIIINFYTPNTTMKEVKVVSSKNLDSNTNQTHFFDSEEKEDENTKVIITLEDFDGSFDVLKVPSWMGSNGIRYQGKKHPDGNYTILGVHFKLD